MSDGAVSARAVWIDADTLRIELRHILLPFPSYIVWQERGDKASLKINRRGMPGWPGVDLELPLTAR